MSKVSFSISSNTVELLKKKINNLTEKNDSNRTS